MNIDNLITLALLSGGFAGWAWGFAYGYSEGTKDERLFNKAFTEDPEDWPDRLPYQVKERRITNSYGGGMVWPWTGGAFEQWRDERRWQKMEQNEQREKEDAR